MYTFFISVFVRVCASADPLRVDTENSTNMAFAWKELADNGPAEVGISAAKSDAQNPEEALILYKTPTQTAVALKLIPQWSELLKRSLRIIAFLAHRRNWVGLNKDGRARSNVIVAQAAPQESKDFDAIQTQLAADLKNSDMFNSATLPVFMAQVSAWVTNHRVGQGGLNRLMKKIFTINPLGAIEDDWRAAVWRASHWLDTSAVWAAWGIKNILIGDPISKISIPGMTRDIAIRMKTFPAGVMRLQIAIAVLKRIRSSILARLFPPVLDLAEIWKTALEVSMNPVRYHVGSQFFSGLPQIVVDVPTESTMLALAAFVHASASGTSLSRAAVLPHEDEVRGHPVYINIKRAQAQFMSVEMEEKQIKEMFGDFVSGVDQFAGIDEFEHAMASIDEEKQTAVLALALRMAGRTSAHGRATDQSSLLISSAESSSSSSASSSDAGAAVSASSSSSAVDPLTGIAKK